MQVRSFTGRSLKDAMNRAKAIFGENIVILDSTRLPITKENPDTQIQLSVGIPDTAIPMNAANRDQKQEFQRYLQSQLSDMKAALQHTNTPGSELEKDSSENQKKLPESFRPYFKKLVELGFDRTLSLDLLLSVSHQGIDGSRKSVFSAMRPLFIKSLPKPGQELFNRNSRMIIPVIGPTGSGKTTTLMKLAVNPLCFGKRKVAILSLDHHRMAAGEQLKQFSKITGVEVTEAKTGEELHQYFKSGLDADIVLVDTPGRSPNFSDYSKELSEQLTLLQPSATLLTIPLTYDMEDILFNSVLYQALGATHLFFTKLDETCRPGKAVSVIRELEIPIAGLGNGQSITDDLILHYGEALWSRIILEM